jgi:hypothetical protein
MYICNSWYLLYVLVDCQLAVPIPVAHISYRQLIAIRYKFKRSTYIQEPLVIGRRGCVQREI